MKKIVLFLCFVIFYFTGCKDNPNSPSNNEPLAQIKYSIGNGLVSNTTIEITDSTIHYYKSGYDYATKKRYEVDSTINVQPSKLEELRSSFSLSAFWRLQNTYEKYPTVADGTHYHFEVKKQNQQVKTVSIEEGIQVAEVQSLRTKLDSILKSFE